MRHSFNRIALATPAALILVICGSAHGQTALGDGRALDANLNANQGKVNPRVNGLEQQIRYNNAVINGTAPNGASFRGSVGYRAPDQFGGSVGSDTLYNFKRDSFSNALAAAGVRGSDALRYQFALTTGQYVPGFMAAAPSGVARSGTVATGASSTALRSTSDFLTSEGFHPTLVGARLDEQGAEYLAKASPLLGVTWVKSSDATLIPPPPGSLQPRNAASPATPEGPGTPGAAPANGAPPIPGATPSSTSGLIENPYNGLQTTTPAPGNSPENPLNRTNPLLDSRVQPESLDAGTMVHNELMTRFREGFSGQAAPSPAPPALPAPTPEKGANGASPASNSLQDQLDHLHRILNGIPEPTPAQGAGVIPRATPDMTPPTQPGGLRAIDKPVIPESSKAATPLPAAPTSLAPKPPTPTPGTGQLPTQEQKDAVRKANPILDALTPEFLRGVKKLQEKKVEHFAEPAPGAGPDTSADPAGYRIMMRQGEKLLSEGRFFDAEDNFVRAVAAAPNDPMARAGRIHAEIGAGLYLSAAANLRALLAASPEIAALRYADRLLPGADRSQSVIEQLAKEEKSGDSSLGREACLLAAYMGYQRADAKALTDGLNEFASRVDPSPAGDTDRALVEFLRKIWIQQ